MANFNTRKFTILLDDIDSTIEVRELEGKVTRERYYKLRHLVRKFNYLNSAPYGVSPNGYAYTCGCMHDCCGCLIGRRATVGIHSDGAIISVFTSFNY